MLKAGIVGLPNVGKSTLFNALTESYQAQSANYPFCTIEPNVGIVTVHDPRLAQLEALIGKAEKVTPAVFEFVDIAGLVRGASKGEGLGNQFLANIREVDAIVHVIRCFDNDDITHVDGAVDPVRDVETIFIELCLADAGNIEKRLEKLVKLVKQKDPQAAEDVAILEAILPFVQNAQVIPPGTLNAEQHERLPIFQLLSTKPMLYAANVLEHELADPSANPHVQALTAHAKSEGRSVVAICAQIEAELGQLPVDERKDYLESLGVATSGVDNLIRESFALLGLCSYFTAGVKEVRAWPFSVGMTAPQCAGIIHTDFEKGFIRAEVTAFADYVAHGGEKGAKEKGLTRLEGKEYIMKDGDVVYFRFNV